jgi:anti-repressor protein
LFHKSLKDKQGGNIMTDSQNTLQIFNFDGGQVRIVLVEGEPCFFAKDIVEGIGAVWNGDAAIGHVPEEWKLLRQNLTSFGEKATWYLKEQGVYFYLARSNKPAALPFQKRIAGEILPSIRKYGGYLTDRKLEEVLSDPDTLIRLAQSLKAEKEKRQILEAKIDADLPKVIFAESVEASSSSILVGDLAKFIKQTGIEIGPKRLFEWLRQNGYLMKVGESRNMPTQRAMEAGLFEVKERAIGNPNGTILLTRTTKITSRGQKYFLNLFRNTLPDRA